MRIVLIVMCVVTIGVAQERRFTPPPPTNLKVLPDTTSGQAVRELMGTFTGALGVRCTYCHVSKEGNGFPEFDFASDAKPQKDIARGMLRMVMDINNNKIKKMFPNDPNPIEVSCVTCHRGTTEPRSIEDIVWNVYTKQGIDPAVARYKELRSQFYGSFTYDFREFPLMSVASRCENVHQYNDAVKFLELNAEYFPDSPHTKTSLASVYIEMNQKEKAKSLLNEVLKAHPNDRRAKMVLENIGN